MTAKEYLKQYEWAVKKAERYREEYKNEALLIDSVRSLSDNDGMPHGSGVSKPTEEKAIRLADKKLRLIQAELDAIEIRQQLFDLIDSIDGPGDELLKIGEILYQRYINLLKWEEVCVVVHLSWRQVHRLHAKGLILIEKKMA